MPGEGLGVATRLVRVAGLMTETAQAATVHAPAGSRHAGWFRAVAIAEAISWTGLLIGMLFKYVLSDNELGVKIFGPIHGTIFIAYVITVAVVRRPLRWTWPTTLLALAASIPPLFTWFFEIWAQRTRRL
jgi:integral membrane protein